MARSRRLADQEALAVSEKKERGRLAVERVKEENEANKLIKEAARIKQWEYEAKLNKDYEVSFFSGPYMAHIFEMKGSVCLSISLAHIWPIYLR